MNYTRTSSRIIKPLVGEAAIQPRNIFKQWNTIKPMYSDLFKALFKIPDKQLQQRVLDAINDTALERKSESICEECKRRVSRKQSTCSTSTQTEKEIKIEQIDVTETPNPITLVENDQYKSAPLTDAPNDGKHNSKGKESKRRKRKNNLPQVIKRSHARQQNNLPILNNKSSNSATNKVIASERMREATINLERCVDNFHTKPSIKRARSDLNYSDWWDANSPTDLTWDLKFCDPLLSAYRNETSPLLTDGAILSKIIDVMMKEYIESEKFDMSDTLGYLPIHDALADNDLDRLRRQIYIWQKLKKIPLSEVRTVYGKDCMEVALNHNSNIKAIKLLLAAGFDVNCFYEEIGSVLHLGIDSEVDLETIEYLARVVQFDILSKENDDGYTPLFMALRHNKYNYFETIVRVIDERLNLKLMNNCIEPSNKLDSQNQLKIFTKFYAELCQDIKNMYKPADVNQNEALQRKRAILDYPDPRSGKTMLLFAIENNLEHFTFLLLANLANPLAQSYTGQSARTFYNEYGKSINMAPKVEEFMEFVETILK